MCCVSVLTIAANAPSYSNIRGVYGWGTQNYAGIMERTGFFLLMSSNRITAIYANRNPGNEVRRLRGQVDRGSGNLLRLTPTAGGGTRKNLVVQRHGEYRRRHVGCNPPGRDRIHLNVVWGEFNGHGLGQL